MTKVSVKVRKHILKTYGSFVQLLAWGAND